jgi:hypothetical protein
MYSAGQDGAYCLKNDDIMKHLYSVTVWRERGEEKERQQKSQVSEMENRLEESEREADRTETKLSLMESVLGKLKGIANFEGKGKEGFECRRCCVSVGTEELYKKCDCGSTPVLSLLGDAKVLNFSPFLHRSFRRHQKRS